MEKKFYIGCVADDFTGAGDVASFFVKAGLVTVLYNGIPDDSHTVAEGTQAVVIALKSRTQDREQAVADSLRAFGGCFRRAPGSCILNTVLPLIPLRKVTLDRWRMP